MARRRRKYLLRHGRPGFGRRPVRGGTGPWASVMVLLVLGLGAVALLERKTEVAATGPEIRDCRVAHVIDGDTLQVRCPSRGVFRARLVGYDAPEVFSPECEEELRMGREATVALRALVEEADDLTFSFGEDDKYGRTLLSLTADGRDVARRMIAAGAGRRYDGGEAPSWCE